MTSPIREETSQHTPNPKVQDCSTLCMGQHHLLSLGPGTGTQQTPGTYCAQQHLDNRPSSQPAPHQDSKNMQAGTRVSVHNAKKEKNKAPVSTRNVSREMSERGRGNSCSATVKKGDSSGCCTPHSNTSSRRGSNFI